jgi:hypothetical protein
MGLHLMGVAYPEAFRYFNLGFGKKVFIPHRTLVRTDLHGLT